MEVANVRLTLNKVGSDVPVNDVTPAEAMFLHILHGVHNGGKTFGEDFTKIEIIGEALVKGKVPDKVEPDQTIPAIPAKGKEGDLNYIAAIPVKVIKGKVLSYKDGTRPRTAAEELNRLRGKYSGARDKTNKLIIDSIWPDRFNPKLPEKFSDLNWQEIAEQSAGITVSPLNYATGDIAGTTTLS